MLSMTGGTMKVQKAPLGKDGMRLMQIVSDWELSLLMNNGNAAHIIPKLMYK